nr:immunoglobulin heavy chain junction region [Mus musculus]NSM04839.1 immunoglobulin heavy chain junction region [Mus musculus]NSM05936.1 immunoglobulin heavy chain junction region [Mus musculus]NSM08497.1 immunoglobulin heavy chain junction region [Mus musculus]
CARDSSGYLYAMDYW